MSGWDIIVGFFSLQGNVFMEYDSPHDKKPVTMPAKRVCVRACRYVL
jgi:hypothetical protein